MYEIRDNQFDFSMTHHIEAPQDVVYGVLADFLAYPDFINDIVSAADEGNGIYKLTAKAAVLTIPARIRVLPKPPYEVAFELVEGPVDELTGKWRIKQGAVPDHSEVELLVHIEAKGRGEWLLRMAGQYVQNKTGKLIQAFSQRIEAVHTGEIAVATRERPGILDVVRRFFSRLWAALTGREVVRETELPIAAKTFSNEHQIDTLEALAETIIPPDEDDDGVRGLGFSDVAEVRSRYEAGRAAMYLTALAAVDQMTRAMFDKDDFVALEPNERTALLDAVRRGETGGVEWGDIKPGSFFGSLWEDVVFLYTTHPDTWERIGWPGASFEQGGYPDYDRQQHFLGKRP